MKQPVVIIGMGELGSVFARALLRSGHPVYPVTREMDMAAQAARLPDPQMVVLAVAEKDLQAALAAMAQPWRDRMVLLQNELLPGDWERHGLRDPTVISVWFEKKKGTEPKVLLPSPVFGPQAALLKQALASIDIPARVLASPDALLFELVVKNVYILTTNIAGLVVGGTVGELWEQHEGLAREVANEVIDIQQHLCAREFDREALIQGMLEAFRGDPAHGCMGRSAPARLQRALTLADEAGLAVKRLRAIARQYAG